MNFILIIYFVRLFHNKKIFHQALNPNALAVENFEEPGEPDGLQLHAEDVAHD